MTAAALPTPGSGSLRLGLADAYTSTRRFVLRGLRQPDVIFGSVLMPVIFVVLFGYVFGSSISVPGGHYRTYLLSGLFAQSTLWASASVAVAVVAGATGRVGRHIVDVLEERGHDVVAISRSLGVDVITGEGLAEALAGVETVIDAATQPAPAQDAATAFFTSSARNLQEVGEQAGVQRIVAVSIIGIDRFTAGFLAAKRAHEQAMLAGPIPAQILRAAQFHEFVAQIVDLGQDGVSYMPKLRTQLVAARTVAEALADLATAPESATSASNGTPIPEIAGPRAESFVEMARLLAARRGDPVRIEGVTDSAAPDRDLYEQGALLPRAACHPRRPDVRGVARERASELKSP